MYIGAFTGIFSLFQQQQQQPPLSSFKAYFLILLGILVSILLPILRKLANVPLGLTSKANLPQEIKPYLWIGLFSAVAAVIVMAFAGGAISTWHAYNAILAGYLWDSTLQKAAKP